MLAKVPVGKTPAELTQSADAAVRALAAADGVKLPGSPRRRAPRPGDRLIIAVSGLLILLIIFVPGRRLRRGRGDRPQPEQ